MTCEEIAEALLIPLWRGTPKGYKIKYARTIWRQFEDQIRSAAYTSSPAKFLDTFVRRMGCELAAHDVVRVAEFLQAADGRALLKMLRDETTLLVLLVRVANEARKEEWVKRREAEEGDDDV